MGWSRPTPRVFADARAALVAHQAAEPVHVDRQHRQAHHQCKVFRTLLAYQRAAPKSKIGQTRFKGRMLTPRSLERGCAFAHTVRLIALAHLRQSHLLHAPLQRVHYVRTVKAPVKTARVEFRKDRLHCVYDRHCYISVRSIPHDLMRQNELVVTARPERPTQAAPPPCLC